MFGIVSNGKINDEIFNMMKFLMKCMQQKKKLLII